VVAFSKISSHLGFAVLPTRLLRLFGVVIGFSIDDVSMTSSWLSMVFHGFLSSFLMIVYSKKKKLCPEK